MDELTDKQRLFVMHYLHCLNATEAAKRAGYKGNRNVLGVAGHENLRNPKIRAAIDAQLADVVMPASEVLARLTDQARGSMNEVLNIPRRGTDITIDLKQMQETGAIHRVKKYSRSAEGAVSIELYDAQAALQLLGKHHALFTDKVQHGGRVDLTQLSTDELRAIAEG